MGATQPYNKSVAGTLGTGMGSLFSPKGRKYFILVHKTQSQYHKMGESQEIIVDNVEIGRAATCAVRFDDSFDHVSRVHAAITKNGDSWKLVHLSNNNPTYINGTPMQGKEWFLENGDEIQFSKNGPKVGFIIPVGEKASVGSIGLTRRLALFGEQALRPYKTALIAMTAVFCIVCGVGGFIIWDQDDKIKELTFNLDEITNDAEAVIQRQKELERIVEDQKKIIIDQEKLIDQQRRMIDDIRSKLNKIVWKTPAEGALGVAQRNTYFVYVQARIGKEVITACTGTGFLLENGYFVTAQHVVNLWESVESDQFLLINAFAHNSEMLDIDVVAISPEKKELKWTFKPSECPFTFGKYKMVSGKVKIDGKECVIRYTEDNVDDRDYAYIKVGKKGQPIASVSPENLKQNEKLEILGFPKGMGAENLSNIEAVHSSATTSKSGVDAKDGCIYLSNSETDHGNSGGPVFVIENSIYKAIGILSGARVFFDAVGVKDKESGTIKQDMYMSSSKGRVVPLPKAIRK